MQKNWYIIYTKSKCEKKVAMSLSRKKIENFYPLNAKQVKDSRRRKLIYEPLFQCYVFANIEEIQVSLLRQIEGFVSLVYWKGRPATVKPEEIEAIREFTADHYDVRLERSHINASQELNSVEGSSYTMGGKILMIKNRSFNLALPSIGFTMIAELEVEGMRGIDIAFGNRELSLQ
jgi:transcription antitermination factor NusG